MNYGLALSHPSENNLMKIYFKSSSLDLYVTTRGSLSDWATVYRAGLKNPWWVHLWEG